MPEIISLNELNSDKESLRQFLAARSADEKKAALHDAIVKTLSLVELNVLVSHVLDGESISEIAARLNYGRTTTYNIYVCARLKLMEIVRPSHGTL